MSRVSSSSVQVCLLLVWFGWVGAQWVHGRMTLVQKNNNNNIKLDKDFVQENESHLAGVPIFVSQPEVMYYTSRETPADVNCVAEPASHATIYCADKRWPFKDTDELEEDTHGRRRGLRVTKMDSYNQPNPMGQRWKIAVTVFNYDVEEWFGSYVCYCEVWNQVDALKRPKKVHSRNATVKLAFFEKQFRLSPADQHLVENARLELHCVPPESTPPSKVTWHKDSVPLHHPGSTILDNSRMTISEASQEVRTLIIQPTQLSDSGVYTCSATSLGVQRISGAAKVVITKPGSWSGWGKWTMCPTHCLLPQTTCPPQCQDVYRVRQRTCIDPKLSCSGAAEEHSICNAACKEGSPTGSYNSQEDVPFGPLLMLGVLLSVAVTILALVALVIHRRRLEKRPCHQARACHMPIALMCKAKNSSVFLMEKAETIENRNIIPESSSIDQVNAVLGGNHLPAPPGGRARSKASMNNQNPCISGGNRAIFDNGSNTNHRYRGGSMTSKSQPKCSNNGMLGGAGGCLDSDASAILSTVDPTPLQAAEWMDLMTTGLNALPTLYSHANNRRDQSASGTKPPSDEMLVPISASIDLVSVSSSHALGNHSCSTAGVVALTASTSMALPPLYTDPGGNPVVRSPAAYSLVSSMETAVTNNADKHFRMKWGKFNEQGGTLALGDTDVHLIIPPGALLGPLEQSVFISLLEEKNFLPCLSDTETLVSSVVSFGPKTLQLHRPVILRFGHCAQLNQGFWRLNIHSKFSDVSLLNFPSELDLQHSWKTLMALDSPASSRSVYAHLHGQSCYVVTDSAQGSQLCLVGQSRISSKATKNLTFMVFCQRRPGTVSSGAGSNTLMRLNNNAATRTLQQTPTAAASSAFSSPHRIPSSNNGGVILKLVIVNDTKDAVDSIIRQHVECYHRSGGQEESYSRRLSCHLPSSEEAGTDGDSLNRDHAWCLLAVVDKFPFTDGGYNLSVSVEQISIGWRCPGHFKYQELNFQSIWSSSSSAAPHSCLFHFDQVDPTRQFLSCKMIAYQHCYNRRQIINIATDRPLIESYEFPPTNAKLSPFRTLSIRLEPFKLSSNMRKSLSRLLDPTVANQSNWKDLALRLGVESRNVPFYGAMKSPTEGLLDLWEAQYHEAANIRGNLDALKDALKAIGRIDAVLLLDETAVAAWI